MATLNHLPARARPLLRARRLSAAPDAMPLGFATTLGCVLVTAAALLAAALPGGRVATATVLMTLAVVLTGALGRDARAAVLVGVAAFAVLDGFGENGSGTLGWHSGDAARLAVLVCAGPAAALVSLAAQRRVHPSDR